MLSLSELGQRLKQAREEKNLTIDGLQEKTKIQKRYLHAIEEGNFSVMPGNFYARAFIKQYAEAVGLDSEALFDEYASEIPKADDDVPDRLSRVNREKQQVSNKGAKFFSFLPTLLVVVLLLGIAVSIWVFSLKNDSPDDVTGEVETTEDGFDEEISIETPSENGQDAPAENENNKDEAEEKTDKEDEKEKPKEDKADMKLEQVNQSSAGTPTTTFELSGTDKFEVELISNKPDGRSYVGVENGNGKSFYAQELNSGNSKTFDFTSESEVELNIGRATDVDIKVNGQKVEYPYPAAETVHQKLVIQFKK
ncbi:DUF4115 domain-containing protein [Bacillus tianshenii]|nr:DUF4115 domain-containing protein [Bacillus tianshenii]